MGLGEFTYLVAAYGQGHDGLDPGRALNGFEQPAPVAQPLQVERDHRRIVILHQVVDDVGGVDINGVSQPNREADAEAVVFHHACQDQADAAAL